MNIDRNHFPWFLAALGLGALATAAYIASPQGATGSSPSGLAFAGCGTVFLIFAGVLPLGKKLARWKLIRLQTLQRGHVWLGLLCLPLFLFHSGFRLGGRLSTALLVVLSAIILSGAAGLLFQHQLPLCKEGKGAKGKMAATIISVGHKITLLLHIPLAVALLILTVFHAVMSLYF